ncbi:MAG TPA: YqgE/AlgH family protein [Gammaproteobacteria bacterium]
MRTLQNHFLIAMPAMGDPNFDGTVTYLCRHSDEGALGIIINRPLDMQVGEVYRQLNFEVADEACSDNPVLGGGPVQPGMGFVLHRSEAPFESTLETAGADIKVTVSKDILGSMASGRGPRPALVALGYAGWDAGQLESEMAANAWLSVPADPEIVFETPYQDRWAAAAAILGVDINQLSSYAGNA